MVVESKPRKLIRESTRLLTESLLGSNPRRGIRSCSKAQLRRKFTGSSPVWDVSVQIRSRSIIAGWSSLVAREAHNLQAAGSNPAPAI